MKACDVVRPNLSTTSQVDSECRTSFFVLRNDRRAGGQRCQAWSLRHYASYEEVSLSEEKSGGVCGLGGLSDASNGASSSNSSSPASLVRTG